MLRILDFSELAVGDKVVLISVKGTGIPEFFLYHETEVTKLTDGCQVYTHLTRDCPLYAIHLLKAETFFALNS